jgi:glycosyltransferase involved in cell wall biosynthesis
MFELSIVIPAYNEEKRILKTLKSYRKYFSSHYKNFEILVILNGCKDKTEKIVSRFSRNYPEVRMKLFEERLGKGGALIKGLKLAKGEIVTYTDADLSTPPEELDKVIQNIHGYDGAFASRYVTGAKVEIEQGFVRRLASRGFNFLVRGLFGFDYRDTQCGAKVMKRHVLDRVIDKLSVTGFAFDIDLLWQCQRNGFVLREIPITWKNADHSTVNLWKAAPEMFKTVLRLKFGRKVDIDHLRILCFNWRDITHPWAGGAELNLHEQAKRWVKMGHDVTIFCSRHPGQSKEDYIDGVKILRAGGKYSVYAHAVINYWLRFIGRFDVILDVENGIPFFAPLFSRARVVLLINHVHKDVFPKELPIYLSWPARILETKVMPFVYRNNRIIVISETTKEDVIDIGFNDKKITVVYPGIDTDAYIPGVKSEYPSISYIGRLKKYKRVDLLLNLFRDVLEEVPDCRLDIVGDGDALGDLKELSNSLGISNNVTFHGFVPEDEKIKTYQKSWAFIQPSSMEGFGLTVIEANACGTPVLAFDVPGLRETVHNPGGGYLVEDNNTDKMKNNIVKLLRDNVLRKKLSDDSVSWANNFSWDKASQRSLEFIKKTFFDEV